MKSLFSLVILFCFFPSLAAQDGWQVEVPGEYPYLMNVYPRDVIVAGNDDILVLMADYDLQTFTLNTIIHRFSNDGDLIWTNRYNPTLNHFSDQILETQDNALALFGRDGPFVSSSAIYQKISADGSNSSFKIDTALSSFKYTIKHDSSCFLTIGENYSKDVDLAYKFCPDNESSNTIIVPDLSNLGGDIVQTLSSISDSSFLVTWRSLFTYNFRIFHQNGSLLDSAKVYKHGEDVCYNQNSERIASYESGVTGDGELIILDKHLSIMSTLEEDVFDLFKGIYTYHIIPTTDGGFVFGGSTGPWPEPSENWLSFLIKVDSQGDIEWRYIYGLDYMPTNIIRRIAETEDGYVILGTNDIQHKVWLTKLNKQGLITSTHNPESQLAQIKVYPNPAYSEITLDIPTHLNVKSIDIYSANGTPVLSTANKATIAIDSLQSGNYFGTLSNSSGVIQATFQFVKY